MTAPIGAYTGPSGTRLNGSAARAVLLMATSLLALSTGLPGASAQQAPAQIAQSSQVAFDIPAQPLAGALTSFGRQAGLQVTMDTAIARGLSTTAISGTMAPGEALNRLLAGSGLIWTQVDARTIELRRQGQSSGGALQLSPIQVEGARSADAGKSEGTGSYTIGSSSSATKLDLSFRETPQSVTVMTRQRLDDQGLNEMKDVLNQAVGVTLVESGALGTDGNQVYVRGFALNNFQVNGIPRSTVYGFNDEIADLATYDRVEIVRGSTGLLNGVGDPSASVNLVRKRPTANFQGYVEGQVGSWDRYRGEMDVSGSLVENGRLRGRFVTAYQDSDSFIDRLEMDKQIAYGTLEADLTEDTLLTVGLEYQKHNSEQASRAGFPLLYADGTPTDFSRSINSAANWAYFMNDSITAFGSLEHRFDNGWKVKLDIENSWREYDGLLGYGVRGNLNQDGTGMGIWPGRWNSDLEQTSIGVDLSGPYEMFGRKHELMLGTSGYHAHRQGLDYPLWYLTGYDPSIPDYFNWNGEIAQPALDSTGWSETKERQYGVYAATRLRPTDSLSVILGSRLSKWEEETRSFPNSGASRATRRAENGVLVPYAGVVYDLTDIWSVYASYTSIFKPQSQKSTSGLTLDPLEGNAYEAGVKAEFYEGRLNASFAVFRIEQDNLAVIDPGQFAPDGSQAYRAAKGTTSEGFEVEMNGELMPGWQIGGGYSRAVPEDANGTRLTTNIPKDSFKLFSTYQLPGEWRDLTVGGNLRWQGDAYSRISNTEFQQDAFTQVDLMLRYQLTDNVSASLNLNNIFDEKYLTDIAFNGYWGEPRSVMVSLRATW
ncbi:MAG: TonB-dependent receptor [Alphaproteobacteria bacterium]|nr:TonB-dependent receptor [Alphaproteobacteria bacterium]